MYTGETQADIYSVMCPNNPGLVCPNRQKIDATFHEVPVSQYDLVPREIIDHDGAARELMLASHARRALAGGCVGRLTVEGECVVPLTEQRPKSRLREIARVIFK